MYCYKLTVSDTAMCLGAIQGMVNKSSFEESDPVGPQPRVSVQEGKVMRVLGRLLEFELDPWCLDWTAEAKVHGE